MDLVLRFKILLLRFIQWIVNMIISYTSNVEKKAVAVSDDTILTLSATVLAEKIRQRQIFSQEIVQSYIRRIKEVNPVINAIVEERFDEALKDAKRADRYLDENPNKIEHLKLTKPFFGIPITIKEAIAVKGLSYTGCSNVRKGIKAEEDSVVVGYLKEAGAIPLLVSTTPEYSTCLETSNKVTGFTCNPYNSLYVSGGSSGGEGALIGAGASLIGIGSDIAGSIRVPAQFNGVFGHKPTKRVVPLEGHWPNSDDESFQNMLAIGPLVRYAEDLKPMLKVMAGPNAEKLKLDEKVDLSKVQIFYMEDGGNNFCLPGIDKDTKTAIKTAAAYLSKECHCHINPKKFTEFDDCIEICSTLLVSMKSAPSPLTASEGNYNVFIEILKEFFGKSIFSMQHLSFYLIFLLSKYTSFNNDKAIQKGNELREMLTDVLADNGVLIFPNYPGGAFKPGDYMVSLASGASITIFNILGLPATAIPTGFNVNGLPVGVQVIAGPHQDRLTVAVAQELEKCFGGWQPKP